MGNEEAAAAGSESGASSSPPWTLSPDDLEPTLAAEVRARVSALLLAGPESGPRERPAAVAAATEAERHVVRRVEEWASASRPGGGAPWWVPVAGLVVLVVLYRVYPSPVEFFALIAGMIAWTVFVALQERRRQSALRRLPERLPAGLLADIAALSAASRAERLYVAALQRLADPSGPSDPAAAGHAALAGLNDLLASSRMLEAQRVELLKALTGQGRDDLDAEARRLRDRLGRAEDPDARAALESALALCAERQERAKRLEGLRERVEAQQEVVHQALLLSAPGEVAEAARRVSGQVSGTGQAVRQEGAARAG